MPKHGWVWRTTQVAKLTHQELASFALSPKMTPKMARWVYRRLTNLPLEWPGPSASSWYFETLVNACLFKIEATKFRKGNAPWAKNFFWRELNIHKGDLIGEWIVERLAVFTFDDPESAERLMELYEDDTAHPLTQGNSLFTLGCTDVPPHLRERFIRIARRALHHPTNAYARAKACQLIQHDPEFRPADVEHLLDDQVGFKPGSGITVAKYAKTAFLTLSSK